MKDRPEAEFGSTGRSVPLPDRDRLGPFDAHKVRILATVGGSILALDLASKWLVQESFFMGQTRPVLGSFFRLTYIVNPGVAFGMHLGEHSALIFSLLGTGVLLFLFTLYRRTPPHDWFRLQAIALVCAGALGNLLDRVRAPSGVVDFFDLGIGSVRGPIFNIADVSITLGAVLLSISFWQEEVVHEVVAGAPDDRINPGARGARGVAMEDGEGGPIWKASGEGNGEGKEGVEEPKVEQPGKPEGERAESMREGEKPSG